MSEYENKKLTKELLDELRSIDGFPIAEDEDIIALSDSPYYTACPNPFIEDFIKEYGKPYDPDTDTYHREPFASDVTEGKNDPIYNAHTYHTKVPHKAIMRYLLHYTEPGDIVFDGFSGTGMTGVAAQLCGSPEQEFQDLIETEMGEVNWGARRAILNDLCPIASFIAYNYNNPANYNNFKKHAQRILNEIYDRFGWMYKTHHVLDDNVVYKINFEGKKNPIMGDVNYFVWSDIIICPNCGDEFSYWFSSIDENTGIKKSEIIICPNCKYEGKIRNYEKKYETVYDDTLNKTIQKIKQKLVFINYSVKNNNGKLIKYNKKPDAYDLDVLKKIEKYDISIWYPCNKIPEGDKTNELYRRKITNIHQLYTKRNLIITANLWKKCLETEKKDRNMLLFWLQSIMVGQTLLNRYFVSSYSQVNRYLKGTIYIAPIKSEVSPGYALNGKIKRFKKLNSLKNKISIISTHSSTKLNIPSNSVDYIFTDPPFGSNIMYSELNFIWESWLKILTNTKKEAIQNITQNKSLIDYKKLMEDCFSEFFMVLKPNRWITVEFHNSKNSVWVAIQEALNRAGFVVSDVRVIDKKQNTMNQMTASGSVKKDLIISAYKPHILNMQEIKQSTRNSPWIFIQNHLQNLPIYVEKKGIIEIVIERQNFVLFDRMIAFFVQRGIAVPISASEFYAGLKQRFPIRDDMYFTVDQVHEYDRKRMKAKRVEQASLFVHDERSAIQWLRRELSRESQTYQDIQPKFLQELYKEKHEDLPELSEILEQNFLQDDEGQWYIPDSSTEADLEKLREKTLLREFQEYKDAKGRLRLFRSEAVRTGFSKCWQEGDYKVIVEVAEKLPINVLQEEPTLLMYYDNAIMRTQD